VGISRFDYVTSTAKTAVSGQEPAKELKSFIYERVQTGAVILESLNRRLTGPIWQKIYWRNRNDLV